LAHGGECLGDQPVGFSIRNTVGAQLLVDPAIYAHCDYSLDITGPRPEREAVEDVMRLLSSRQFASRGHDARDRSRH
jgi:hypothetical protein